MPLAPAKGAEAPSRATEGAHEGAKAAALVEHDFSHWARRALAARLGGLRHARHGAGATVRSSWNRMDDERSEVTFASARTIRSPCACAVRCCLISDTILKCVYYNPQKPGFVSDTYP